MPSIDLEVFKLIPIQSFVTLTRSLSGFSMVNIVPILNPSLWPDFIWILAEFREGLPFWPHFIWVFVQFRGIAVFNIIRFTMENGLPAEGCQRI